MIHVQLPSWSKALRAKTAPDGEPARFRAVRGGRGGGKSWTVATMLVLRALEGTETILCARASELARRLVQEAD